MRSLFTVTHSCIHPVFHASMLKPFLCSPRQDGEPPCTRSWGSWTQEGTMKDYSIWLEWCGSEEQCWISTQDTLDPSLSQKNPPGPSRKKQCLNQGVTTAKYNPPGVTLSYGGSVTACKFESPNNWVLSLYFSFWFICPNVRILILILYKLLSMSCCF